MSECIECEPELGECNFCPYSSSGKMNIAERGGPTEDDETFFGIVISEAPLETQKLIHECIRKENKPNY